MVLRSESDAPSTVTPYVKLGGAILLKRYPHRLVSSPSFLKVMITWRHFLAFVSLILVCWLNLPFPWNRMLSASSSVRCSMLQTGEGRGVNFVGNLSYVWSLPYSFWDCSSSSCYPTRLGTVQLSRYNNLCSPTPELGWSSRLHI